MFIIPLNMMHCCKARAKKINWKIDNSTPV